MTKLPLPIEMEMIIHDPLSRGKQSAFGVAGETITPALRHNEMQESKQKVTMTTSMTLLEQQFPSLVSITWKKFWRCKISKASNKKSTRKIIDEL